MTYLAATGTVLGLVLLWAWAFYVGFSVGRRAMMRDLGPYLPREPDGSNPFRDPLR